MQQFLQTTTDTFMAGVGLIAIIVPIIATNYYYSMLMRSFTLTNHYTTPRPPLLNCKDGSDDNDSQVYHLVGRLIVVCRCHSVVNVWWEENSSTLIVCPISYGFVVYLM